MSAIDDGNVTLALIKPDAFRRRHVGDVISYIEDSSLKMSGVTHWRSWKREVAEEFYGRQHAGKPYFEILINHLMSGEVLGMLLEGPKALETWRHMMGSADPNLRRPGSIRYDLAQGCPIVENLVHGSDSPESFRHEAQVLLKHLPWSEL
jgi:nucleoside-diphosphate kinase